LVCDEGRWLLRRLHRACLAGPFDASHDPLSENAATGTAKDGHSKAGGGSLPYGSFLVSQFRSKMKWHLLSQLTEVAVVTTGWPKRTSQ
jgi:hypothetical protein